MGFWDEQVAVFVASAVTGAIEPRSRVFAEAGEAMWAARQDLAGRRDWISAALADDDHREQVVLAAGLSPDVASDLIEAACHATDPSARSRGLLWAADATADGAQPTTESLTALIDALAEGAASPPPSRTQPHGEVTKPDEGALRLEWPYALRIAILPLPGPLRTQRSLLLAGLALDEDERPLAAALAALADAGSDARDTLDPGQEDIVRRLLARQLPGRNRPAEPGTQPAVRARQQGELLPGYLQAAEEAARYARQLGQDAVSAIYRIARRGYLRDYARIGRQLIAQGYPDPEPPRLSVKTTDGESLDLWDDWQSFFTAAASLGAPRALTAAEQWRYPDLASLCDVLGTQTATLTGIADAFTTDQILLPGCMKAAADAAGLEVRAISAEAIVVMEEWPAGNRDIINVMFAPPPSLPPAFDSTRLDSQDKDTLVEALGATSDWLAGIAYALLLSAHDPVAGQRAADQVPHIAANRREKAAIVAVANDPSPPDAVARFLDGAEPLTRVGAAAAARFLAESGDARAWTALIARAARRTMT